MLEQAKRMPPAPMDKLAPHELRGYTKEELAARGNYQNPRTGKWSTVGGDIKEAPILDSPIVGGRSIVEGVQQTAQPGLREKAAGANKIIGGGFKALEPLIVGTGLTAPMATMTTVGTAMGVGTATEKALKAAGVPNEYAELAGNAAAIAAGGKASKGLRDAFSGRGVETVKVPNNADSAGSPITKSPAEMLADQQAETRRLQEERHKLTAKLSQPPEARTAAPKVEPAKGKPTIPSVQLQKPTEPPKSIAELQAEKEELTAENKQLKAKQPLPPGPGAKEVAEPPVARAAEEPLNVKESDIREPPKDTSVTLGTGLAAIDPYLKDAWGEMRDMAVSRKRAMDELEKVKATPENMKFGQAVLENFVGERDWWGTRVNQAMERVRKVVPDVKDREALSIMRENTPAQIEQYLNGTHLDLQGLGADERAVADRNIERLKPVLQRALNPSEAMKKVNPLFTRISKDTLVEGKRIGNLESRWTDEQYVPHILHPEGEGELPTPVPDRLGKALGGKIGKYFAHAATRDWPTFMDAIIHNVQPKTMDIVDAFTTHGDSFATSRATHMLVNQLKDTGVGMLEVGKAKAPKGWVDLAPHSEEFKSTIKHKDASGEDVQYKLPLKVPKYVSDALRPVTDPDFIKVVPGFSKGRAYQTYMKSVQLGISLFHATTENYMAMYNMGPKGWAKALAADRDSPEFRQGEQDFIADGGTTSVQGQVIEAFKRFQPGSIPSWGDIARRAPVARQMDQAIQATSEFTFNNLQRKFKVMDYEMHKAAWIADHPDATPEQIQAAGKSIAKETNAVYGGLNRELLGYNKTTHELTKAILLAPDWLFSNIFNVKYALEGGPKAIASQAARAVGADKAVPESWEGSAGSDLARKFWIRQAVGGVIATQMLSLAYSGKTSKNPTQVYYGKDPAGNDVYQNVFFKGASGDVINFITNVHDHGLLLGTARTVSSKLAGIPRATMHLMENKDSRGKPIAPPGMNPVASTVRAAGSAAKELAPIPIGGSTTYDMLFGPDAWKYSAKEVVTTLLSGTPPRHVKPEKPGKPPLSIWEQIKTGDVHHVNHRKKPGQPPD
jgi:hypothetical protein